MINDTPGVLSGCQPYIQIPDGYCIPISKRYYPRVFFTLNMPLDPNILDSEFSAKGILFDEDEPITPYYHPSNLNNYGEVIKYQTDFHEISDVVHTNVMSIFYLSPQFVRPKVQSFNKLEPNFGFAPAICIQKTLENTTQFARLDTRLPLRKHYKSRFPAANVSRLNTYFSDVVAADVGILGHGGATMLQLPVY